MQRAEIIEFLQGKDDDWLFTEADRIRREVFGDEIYLRGIIEFTNYCRQNCYYCGLRRSNRAVQRYRLTREEILAAVETALAHKIPTIVLQGGEDPYYSAEWIADLIREIIEKYDLAITLSLGEQTPEVLQLWWRAGATRYLLRIETWNRENYSRLRPERQWENRLNCLKVLRELDYEVGSGIMVGLPGETLATLAEAIIGLTELDLDMIGIGPFIAHPQTSLGDQPNGSIELTLRTLALMRILNPYANMPATSAMECAEKGARLAALKIGMNVIMPSITPERVKMLYNIYPGKNADSDVSEHSIPAVLEIIREAGFRPSLSKGISPNLIRRHESQNILSK
ncbi:MAG TPA: [FeFe] hydrogenase H-cluster radical SAM maturase HydE [Candidatus Marinimicrobia bacterium]|nr:[FeFe] hydrogenase H-cluster radical SAM maturase HydE [Candidatus Neomarinimicrobiota bacterium]HRS51568.1 [FeFe] hydrogenase H-cluster radical SAM maturase HydE [Candidatus Neomarinimicrobiota bacterium]